MKRKLIVVIRTVVTRFAIGHRNNYRARNRMTIYIFASRSVLTRCQDHCGDCKKSSGCKCIINMNGARGSSRHITANKTSPPYGNRMKYALSIVVRTVVRKCRGNVRPESIVVFLKSLWFFCEIFRLE